MSDHAPLVQFVLSHLRVTVNVCTRQVHEQGYRLERRTVPDYNLIFVTRGQPVWVIQDEEHALGPGMMLIVPPRTWHRAYCRTRQLTLGSIHVEAALPGGQDVFDLLRPRRVIGFAPASPLEGYLRGALAEFDRPSFHDARLMLSSWARLAVIELLRQAHRQDLLHPRPLDPVVAKVLEHLTSHVADPLSLDDLAGFAGYTPQHLNRVFRHMLGVTPLQYLARLRMDQAAGLLVQGRLTVRAVAQAVGFDDPYYFSRSFKQHFGRSPAHYRDGPPPPA